MTESKKVEDKISADIPDYLKKALDEGPDPGTHEWIRHQQKSGVRTAVIPDKSKPVAEPSSQTLSPNELKSRINKLLGGEKNRAEIRARTEKENSLRVRAIRARGY